MRGLWGSSPTRLQLFSRYVFCLVLLVVTACADEPPTLAPSPVPTSVEVTPASSVLRALGDNVQLNARVLDQNGQVMTSVTVIWSTTDSAVSTVSPTGLVTAVGNGSASATATAGNASGSASVTVSQIATLLRLLPEADTLLALQDTLRLTTHATDANGHPVAVADYVWSSSDTLVASVDTVGLVIAVANGVTEIVATYGLLTGKAVVTVSQIATLLQLLPEADTLLALQDTLRLTTHATDANGHPVAVADYVWSSSDTLVASVDTVGLVIAVANGVTEIVATYGLLTGKAVVTVAQEAKSMGITPAVVDLDALADTVRLTPTPLDANGHPVSDPAVVWSSSDTLVASVDTVGLVIAVANGVTEIVATYGLLTGKAVVTVAQEAKSMGITPAVVDLDALADTVRLTPTPLDANGHPVSDPAVVWSSSDQSVARVDDGGLVTAMKNGIATVTASLPPVVATATVTVAQKAVRARVNPLAAALELVGDTLRLAAAALDANDSLVAGFEFAWISDDTSVAVVDMGGLVTGKGRGTAWIKASSDFLMGQSPVSVASGDRGVLITLYHATGGPNWKRDDNWLTDTPLNSWFGVRAYGADVSSIELLGNGLTGRIPPGLTNLAKLQSLKLRWNKLTGTIPASIGRMLSYLDLSANELTGPVPPELGHLPRLNALYLGNNALTGTIPRELGSLHTLNILSLGGNRLHGPIPLELTTLPILQYLRLDGNDLSGPIPSELARLTNLRKLLLSSNELSGPIPSELARLTNLRELSLSYNELSGPIPPELTTLQLLWHLRLDGNDLSGPIPPELGGLENLISLDLAKNELSGTLPAAFGNLANLETLDLAGNNFTGAIPPELGGLENLRFLDLANNDLTGPLPAAFGNLANLETLHIEDNQLEGDLPMELTNLPLYWFIWHSNDWTLCAPADSSFQAWLRSIRDHQGGPNCTASARSDGKYWNSVDLGAEAAAGIKAQPAYRLAPIPDFSHR